MLVINANEFEKFIAANIVETKHFMHFALALALASFCC